MKYGGTFNTKEGGSTLRYLLNTDNYIDYLECLVNFPIHCYNTNIVATNSRYSLNLVIKKLPNPNLWEMCRTMCEIQKQPSRGVLKKRCSENIQQIYWRTPMLKCDSIKLQSKVTFTWYNGYFEWADRHMNFRSVRSEVYFIFVFVVRKKEKVFSSFSDSLGK